MKTLENVWRLVICVFIFFVIRDKIDKMLAPPQLEPKIEWSQFSKLHDLENRQIPPLYFPPKTEFNWPPAQVNSPPKLNFKWDHSPATTPTPNPFGQPVAAPPADNPLQLAPFAPATATE